MKKHNYHITRDNMRTVETFRDASGNIIIPAQYVIRDTDSNAEKGRKNRMWLKWQKRRKIEPVTDLPNYTRTRKYYESDMIQHMQYRNVSNERRQKYATEQRNRIAELEQQIAELQAQRDNTSGARYDELTTRINILRCKVIQTEKPVWKCDTANPQFY